jgi:hypothetical protein
MGLKKEIQALRDRNCALLAKLETAIVRQDALELAMAERLGRDVQDGDLIVDRDLERREEIARFWTADLRDQQANLK